VAEHLNKCNHMVETFKCNIIFLFPHKYLKSLFQVVLLM
jgi:hypothetical protein